MWCRAFDGTHITPPVLRAMRIREVGILFGADVADPEPMLMVARESSASARAVEVD